MSLVIGRPDTWTFVTITGSYMGADGTAASGWLTFEPSKTVIYNSSVVVEPTVIVAPLTVFGGLSVDIPCTDDVLLNTSDWYWIVTEHIPNGRAPFKIQVTGGTTSAVGPLPRALESITKVAL